MEEYEPRKIIVLEKTRSASNKTTQPQTSTLCSADASEHETINTEFFKAFNDAKNLKDVSSELGLNPLSVPGK